MGPLEVTDSTRPSVVSFFLYNDFIFFLTSKNMGVAIEKYIRHRIILQLQS